MTHYSEDELSAYLDNEVDEKKYESIRSHLERCPSCLEYIEQWNACRKLFQADVQTRPYFTSQVLHKIERSEKAANSSKWSHLIFDQLLPGLSLAFGIALLVFQGQPAQKVDAKTVLFSYFSEKEVNQIVADEEYEATSLLGLRQE